MGLLRIALFVLVAGPGSAVAADQVREAEIAFARAFTDRDQARFFSFVADDATPRSTESMSRRPAARCSTPIRRWRG